MKNYLAIFACCSLMLLLYASCSSENDSFNQVRLSVDVTDIEGNPLEKYPLDIQNLNADTLLRSTKLYHIEGDSIILPKEASEFMIHLTTNASWRISKQKAWGAAGSITWLANPKPIFGGGNSMTTSSVRANTSTKDRRAYLYVTTGDSACMKKYVILQKGNY